MDKITDFGKKISGAKKNVGKTALQISDLSSMDMSERVAAITRDAIFLKPNFSKMYEDGVDPAAIWYIDYVRKGINKLPLIDFSLSTEEIKEDQEYYISCVEKIRDKLLTLRKEDEIPVFTNWMFKAFFVVTDDRTLSGKKEKNYCFCSTKLVNRMQASIYKCRFGECRDMLGIPKEVQSKELGKLRYLCAPFDSSSMQWISPTELRIDSGYVTSIFKADRDSIFYNETLKTGYLVLDCMKQLIKAAGLNWEEIEDARLGFQMLSGFHFHLYQDYQEEQKKQKKETAVKKEVFIPTKIVREGPDYLSELPNHHAQGENFLNVFGFKGGEFGSSVSQKERQKFLDRGYEAFKDLAFLLDIEDRDVSLGGNLSVSFGARGRGTGLAYYETINKTITLTRFKGSGTLAHEWMHALDHYYSYFYRGKDELSTLYTKSDPVKGNDCFNCLVANLLYRTADGEILEGELRPSDFYINAYNFDNTRMIGIKQGYWSSISEVLARAFEAYIEDKMEEKGIRSDYLLSHKDEVREMLPQGEERERINKKFDIFFDDLCKRGLLHRRK